MTRPLYIYITHSFNITGRNTFLLVRMNYSIKCTNQDNIIKFNSLLAQTQITYTKIDKYPNRIDTNVTYLNGVNIVCTTFI
jgi:hypothetical protein